MAPMIFILSIAMDANNSFYIKFIAKFAFLARFSKDMKNEDNFEGGEFGMKTTLNVDVWNEENLDEKNLDEEN